MLATSHPVTHQLRRKATRVKSVLGNYCDECQFWDHNSNSWRTLIRSEIKSNKQDRRPATLRPLSCFLICVRDISNSALRRFSCEYSKTELKALSQQWDRHIRHFLGALAQSRWPDRHIFGLIPRTQLPLTAPNKHPGDHLWVEHELPPYDLFRCAAYRVFGLGWPPWSI
jgi:hypothetical protein